jgi:hypothetical protein
MATGKRPLILQPIYNGDVDGTLRELVTAMQTVKAELSATPGIGELTAGEAIDCSKAVRIVGSKLFLADAAGGEPAVGISISSSAVNSKCRYILGMGYSNRFSGLTPNSSIYLGNAGGLVFAIPGAGMKQALGWAFSETEAFVTIGQPF